MSNKTLHNETETLLVGEAIARNLSPGIFVSLKGDLGAGKTCLARGILRGLGHTGRVKSPTYPLVEIYHFEKLTVYHFDFYRIADPAEIIDAGFREVFDGSNVCIVEWADKAGEVICDPDITLSLTINSDSRTLSITSYSDIGKTCSEGIL